MTFAHLIPDSGGEPVPGSVDTATEGPPAPRQLACTLPEVGASGCTLGGLTARAMTMRGAAHVAFDEPRQDAYGLLESADQRWLAGAVADGIGSCAYSHVGAEAAARAACMGLVAQAERGGIESVDLGAVTDAAARAAESHASAVGVSALEVSSTLTAVLADTVPDAHGAYRCLVISVGDSPLYLGAEREDRAWAALLPHDRERPSNVVTAHVPTRPEGAITCGVALRAGGVLLVCTDGLGDPIGSGETPMAEYLAERWSTPPSTWRFAVDAAAEAPGHLDDRTAIALWASAADPGRTDEPGVAAQ